MGKRINDPEFYGSEFYEGQARGSRSSAHFILPIVQKLVSPASVLDVGCGVGTWLAEWISLGVTDVLGLDGDYIEKTALQIPPDKFVPTNLQSRLSLGRRFDLVQTLEVAEHLDAAYADLFVEAVTSHGDVILFSAAIPGQGGTHHVNEQWPSYWIEKFARAGFTAHDIIRPLIWTDNRIDPWYRQNTLLFSKERIFGDPASCPDLVHPALWTAARSAKHESRPRRAVRKVSGKLTTLARQKLATDRPQVTAAFTER